MGADQNIDLSLFQISQHLFLFGYGHKTVQNADFHREITVALRKGAEVLLGKNGGRA